MNTLKTHKEAASGIQATRLLQARMESAAKRLEQHENPYALAELIAGHYVRLASLALSLSKLVREYRYAQPSSEVSDQIVSRLCAEITNDFRVTFGYNPPWCYRELGERGLSPADERSPTASGEKGKQV